MSDYQKFLFDLLSKIGFDRAEAESRLSDILSAYPDLDAPTQTLRQVIGNAFSDAHLTALLHEIADELIAVVKTLKAPAEFDDVDHA